MPPTRSFAIIGVVGSTYSSELQPDHDLSDPQREVLGLAESVGRSIAGAGQVLLTGGHHNRPETSVKYRSIRGAVQASRDCRLIGILPIKASEGLGVREVCAVRDP